MPSPPRHPIDALWQPPAIVWTILAGECLALIATLSPVTTESRLIVFGLASFLIQWTALLTLGSLYMLRRRIRKLAPPHVAWLALVLLLVSSWSVALVAQELTAPYVIPQRGGRDIWGGMLRLTGSVLAIGILGLAAFHNHWRALQAMLRAKQAELEALQARTHPHFLFNTLNTGAALVHAQPAAAETLLLDLADLFRAALGGPARITLEAELDLSRRYLSIEQLRLGSRLQVQWQLPEPVPAIEVPSLSLQPLLENAVRHGIEQRVEGGTVLVRIHDSGQAVEILVINDAAEGGSTAQGHGIGLASVKQRLREMTAGAGMLTTHTGAGTFQVRLVIPRHGSAAPGQDQATTS